jgi:hypothetical protein
MSVAPIHNPPRKLTPDVVVGQRLVAVLLVEQGATDPIW